MRDTRQPYSNNISSTNQKRCSCCICGHIVSHKETVTVCPKCNSIFCQVCVEDGALKDHNCKTVTRRMKH